MSNIDIMTLCILIVLLFTYQFIVLFIATISDKKYRDKIYYVKDLFEQMTRFNKDVCDEVLYMPLIGFLGAIFITFVFIMFVIHKAIMHIPGVKWVKRKLIDLYNSFINIRIRKQNNEEELEDG